MSVLRSFSCGVAGIMLGAFVLAAAPAQASPIVQFDISVLGGSAGPYVNSFSQIGTPTAVPQVYNYQGSLNDPSPFAEWSIINWDFNADGDITGSGPNAGARIASVFTVQNNRPDGPTAGDNHLRFSIMVSMNVSPTAAATGVFGNGGMTLTIDESPNGFPGTLTAVNTAIWNFRANNADVATLFDPGFILGGSNGPSTISTSGNLSAAQTGPLLGMVVTSMGIRLDFDLSPGERVTFNGAWAFIPAPGALALLGLAGLAGRSRRRN